MESLCFCYELTTNLFVSFLVLLDMFMQFTQHSLQKMYPPQLVKACTTSANH